MFFRKKSKPKQYVKRITMHGYMLTNVIVREDGLLDTKSVVHLGKYNPKTIFSFMKFLLFSKGSFSCKPVVIDTTENFLFNLGYQKLPIRFDSTGNKDFPLSIFNGYPDSIDPEQMPETD